MRRHKIIWMRGILFRQLSVFAAILFVLTTNGVFSPLFASNSSFPRQPHLGTPLLKPLAPLNCCCKGVCHCHMMRRCCQVSGLRGAIPPISSRTSVNCECRSFEQSQPFFVAVIAGSRDFITHVCSLLVSPNSIPKPLYYNVAAALILQLEVSIPSPPPRAI